VNNARAQSRLNWRHAVLAVFVLSRIVLLSIDTPGSMVMGVNLNYAYEIERASRLGLPFYEMHERNRAEAEPTATPVERLVEYPPLALVWMSLPTWFLDPIPAYGFVPEAQMRSGKFAIRLAGVLVDGCGFALLVLMGASAARLAFYTAGGLLLFPFLIDTFDLLLGVMVLAAMFLLLRRGPIWAPLAMLALAINVKVTPLILVPLFLMGTLPADALRAPVGRELATAILKRAALLAAFGVLLFAPFFIRDGAATLEFLKYHSARGLEIEATLATIPMALAAIFQQPSTVLFRFSAVELQSPITGPLIAIASVATLAVIPGLAIALWILLRRRVGQAPGVPGAQTLAQAHPRLFLHYALVSLLTAMVAAKVLSPQYLLWLLPLAALWEGRRIGQVCAVFCVMCALTTTTFPFIFAALHNAARVWPGYSYAMRLLIASPLLVRNVLLVGLTVWCWNDMVRAAPAESTPVFAKPAAPAKRRSRAG
jgi:hypothetical protein